MRALNSVAGIFLDQKVAAEQRADLAERRLAEAEAALAVVRKSLTEQADARADPTMPVLSEAVFKELQETSEAHCATAETREERVFAHGLSLLADWQKRARATYRSATQIKGDENVT